MKKLVLLLAVVFSVSLISCGGAAETTAEAEEAAVVEEVVDSVAADTVGADTVVADTVVAE